MPIRHTSRHGKLWRSFAATCAKKNSRLPSSRTAWRYTKTWSNSAWLSTMIWRRSEEAFTYVEQAKSRSLMDLFVSPAPAHTENTSGQSELVHSIKDLREELNWYYNLIEREQLQPEQRSPERIATLQEQARHREKELVRVLQEATETDATQAGLQTPSHVPLATIRAAIPADTLIVEYFRVRDRILVCVLGQETLEILPVTLETQGRQRVASAAISAIQVSFESGVSESLP